MTVEEIFSLLAERMVEGLMTHSQMSDYFHFLGLEGYAECHRYHYFEENANYRKICDYYMSRYNKLIQDRSFQNPNVIPENWYLYLRTDVDNAVRKAGIKTGFEKWVQWEKETKNFYEYYYKELINLNEIAAAMELKKYICDVDKELAKAEQKILSLKITDYNISDIIVEQEEIHKKYRKKLKKIKLC